MWYLCKAVSMTDPVLYMAAPRRGAFLEFLVCGGFGRGWRLSPSASILPPNWSTAHVWQPGLPLPSPCMVRLVIHTFTESCQGNHLHWSMYVLYRGRPRCPQYMQQHLHLSMGRSMHCHCRTPYCRISWRVVQLAVGWFPYEPCLMIEGCRRLKSCQYEWCTE
jgi:hypothetical protein